MHEILVDGEVFGRLQGLAQPFVDSPNSVLRRVLGLDQERESGPPSEGSAPAGWRESSQTSKDEMTSAQGSAPPPMTPQREFRPVIVELLKETGGGRRMHEVLEGIEERLGPRFHPHDHEAVSTGELRWRNSARWERMKMADEGLIKKGTP